ncbi:hypothetical protein GCM10007907_27030 [Chitinimonas prasina]|uniref:DUF3619 family protein n=1 Tax=Chitinimonas prasina TaxID=1434937 RepID=A0ABQ5YJS8_9NEIS|nr:DUF3619 family protein [Chitinimonas prasina]GLR13913.1 hypothetical protein GCM10007907_27030 [Chitinimonas prasina]
MSKSQWEEDTFGKAAASQLAAQPLSLRQQQRLAQARQVALALQQAGSRGWRLGLVRWLGLHPVASRRAGQAAWLALCLGVGLFWWQQGNAGSIDDDIDAQLLADEVPMEVWLSDSVEHLAREAS